MSIENKINMLSKRISDVNRVIGPNNLNSAALSSISSELIQLEANGADVLSLRNRYSMLQSRISVYQRADRSSRIY